MADDVFGAFDDDAFVSDAMSSYFPRDDDAFLTVDQPSYLTLFEQDDLTGENTAAGTLSNTTEPVPSGYSSFAYHAQASLSQNDAILNQAAASAGSTSANVQDQSLLAAGSLQSTMPASLAASSAHVANAKTTSSRKRSVDQANVMDDRTPSSPPARRRNRTNSKSRPIRDHLPSGVTANGGGISNRKVLTLTLSPEDDMQCRFAVKNDEKEGNQRLPFVQANGYVEYKARYCKKRGQQIGYGQFNISFVSASESIYPLLSQPSPQTHTTANASASISAPLFADETNLQHAQRVDIYIRFYQSWRGDFPANKVVFNDEEVYHPLFVKEWQDATLLARNQASRLTAHPDPDGEHLRYTMDGPDVGRLLASHGLSFPCPIPAHPERLNDVGMLRMQVTMRLFFANQTEKLVNGMELSAWIRIKIVQQLSGKKPRFAQMRRPAAAEFTLPRLPTIVPSPAAGDPQLVGHLIGSAAFEGGNAVRLLQGLVREMAARAVSGVRSIDSASSQPRQACILHEACSVGDVGLVLMLLQQETVMVHSRDACGNTPLHCAALHGHVAVATLLVEAGASITVNNSDTKSPIDVARDHGFKHMADLLLQHDQRDQTGQASLMRASAAGYADTVKKSIAAGADPNQINAQGHTPLLLAVSHNNPLCVLALLQGGADVDCGDLQGRKPIHVAVARGSLECLVILLQQKPSTVHTTTTKGGLTPLHIAVQSNQPECVQVLLHAGANATQTSHSDVTAIEVAMKQNQPENLALLLSHVHSVSDIYRQRLASLCTHAQTGGNLLQAASQGDVVLARQLLSDPGQMTLTDEMGNTPIHQAALNGNMFVLDALFAHVRDMPPDQQDSIFQGRNQHSQTALHAACTASSLSCLIYLLSSKTMDVNAQDVDGNTALHIAAARGLVFHCAFLRLGGADATKRNAEGNTASALALKSKYIGSSEVFAASQSELVTVSKGLEARPEAAQPLEPTERLFNWLNLKDVISRLWHATHDARSAVSAQHRAFRAS